MVACTHILMKMCKHGVTKAIQMTSFLFLQLMQKIHQISMYNLEFQNFTLGKTLLALLLLLSSLDQYHPISLPFRNSKSYSYIDFHRQFMQTT